TRVLLEPVLVERLPRDLHLAEQFLVGIRHQARSLRQEFTGFRKSVSERVALLSETIHRLPKRRYCLSPGAMAELVRVAKRLPFPFSAHGSGNCARMGAFEFVEQAVVDVAPSLRRPLVPLDPTGDDPSGVPLDCLHFQLFSVRKEILC